VCALPLYEGFLFVAVSGAPAQWALDFAVLRIVEVSARAHVDMRVAMDTA